MLQSQIPLKDVELFKKPPMPVSTPSAIVDRLLELLKS
jgi:hypothetical protein